MKRLLAVPVIAVVLMAASPGTVKIDTDNSLPNNEPHVCALDVRDWMSDSADYTILSWPPTGDGTVVLTGVTGNPETIALPNGHYKIESGHRQKVFWVECDPVVPPPPPVAPPPVVTTPTIPPATVELLAAPLPETDTRSVSKDEIRLYLSFALGALFLVVLGTLAFGGKRR